MNKLANYRRNCFRHIGHVVRPVLTHPPKHRAWNMWLHPVTMALPSVPMQMGQSSCDSATSVKGGHESSIALSLTHLSAYPICRTVAKL